MTMGFGNLAARAGLAALMCACASALTGCGNHGGDASQVVASVGGDEITETQVNRALEREGSLRPDQVDAASRKVVSGLVEQAIVLQKARDLKLDRDERVMQNIEAMKRELLVAAYVDRISDGAGKPMEKDVQAYYDDNPELFAKRRLYSFEELAIDASPAQAKEIEAQLAQLKSAPEIGDYLRSRQIVARSTQSTKPAEGLPLVLLKRVALLKPGQGLIVSNDGGLHVLLLQGTQDAALTEDQARPAITAFLSVRSRREAVAHELASLQAGAKVAYFGKYAGMAASAPAGAGSTPVAGPPDAPVRTSSADPATTTR